MIQATHQAASHRFDPSIFREYDIRGVVDQSFNPADAYVIGCAFAEKVRAGSFSTSRVCVGRDGRVSSPALCDALREGLASSGLDVVDIGLGPTPMLYFASCELKAAGGVMVTGSHNPPDHNGLKFMLNGQAFYGADIASLKTIGERGGFIPARGTTQTQDMREAYLARLLMAYKGGKPIRAAWDAGNGAAGEMMQRLCERLPGEHMALNAVIDGTFPNHHPDPTVPKNLEQLIEVVTHQKLDCGIAFDGDGDRIGVVDDEGEILWGDQLLMLYAAEILARQPGATIIADVKASDALFAEVARLGGQPLMWKTGHSLIKAKMKETHAPLAGEMSGHLFFADEYYGYDDALYAAVRLIRLLAQSRQKLSELRKALPQRVNTPEIRFSCPDTRKFGVIDEVKTRLTEAGATFSPVDGVRVSTADGWWLLRASNTQPMLVARCEARDQAGLNRLKEDLRQQLALSNVALP